MSRNIIYLDDGTVPPSVPVGRVLSGTNDFRGWTDSKPWPRFVRCHCGWAHGLPHYARSEVAVAR